MSRFMESYWQELINCGHVVTRAGAVEEMVANGFTYSEAAQIQALYLTVAEYMEAAA